MKNTLSFLVFTLFALCSYAQKAKPKVVYETIIIYDTITVYDTITIYDTIKIENKVQSENNFKNNFTAEKAYLAIDTTDFSAAVLLINKKDTATLSVNSIILSETNKNLDTMKKSLLTLLVSAALTQAAKSQESVNTKSNVDEVFPSYTVNVGAISEINTQGSGKSFYGINFKINKNINKKNSLGISSDVGYIYKSGYKPNNPNLEGSVTSSNLSGLYSNIFINHNYYFIKNTQKAKGGVYLISGLGMVYYNSSQKEIYFEGDESKYKTVSLNISAQIGIGSEVNLNKGKLFAELISIPSLVEFNTINNQQKSLTLGASNIITKRTNTIINNYSQQLILRIGYKFNI